MKFPTPSAARRRANRLLPVRLLSAALLLLGWAAVAAADPVSDFEAMRMSQQRTIEESLKNLPPVPGGEDRPLSGVLRLGMERGNLVARTPLPSTRVPGYARARVPEFGQPLMVRVVGGAEARAAGPGLPASAQAGSEAVVPSELLVQANDYSTPGRFTSLSLSQSGGAVFSLARVETTPTGSRRVQFLEQKVAGLPAGGGVSLVVNESDFRSGAAAVNETLAAPTCAELLRRHPAEVEQYLRPLLASLGAESAFAPDAVLAEQVFPGRFAPDPAARRRVEALLPGLSADDFHRRDQALSALEALGPDAVKAVSRMDRSRLTPEQNARIDRALTPLGLLPRAEAERLAGDPAFLLNCLYCDDPATRAAALERLAALTGQTVGLPADAGPAARAAAVRDLRRRIGPASRPAGPAAR